MLETKSLIDGPFNLEAGAVIDAGIHHRWANQSELVSFMPRSWRSYIGSGVPLIPDNPYQNPLGDYLAGTGLSGPPGSDPETVIKDVFKSRTARAILVFDRSALIPAMANHYIGLQATRAANRWTVEHWLNNQDKRLYGLVLVPNQLPLEASKEIRRVGQHSRMVGILMCGNGIGKPFGHPLYEPIYAAAVDLDLPVVIQAGGDATPDTLTDPTPGGLPLTYGEFSTLMACALFTHVISMVAQGVFEKFPSLKVLLMGAGATWIPWVFWRADTAWKALRREIPWVRRFPSEYLRQHILVDTHPVNRSTGRPSLLRHLNTIEGIEDLLCFTSSYPYWNSDTVADVASILPGKWHQKVFHDNSERFFRWSKVEAADTYRERQGTSLHRSSPITATRYPKNIPESPSSGREDAVDID
jgi:predicted TIM-barrel fold metal-dependent hydrolase